MLFRNEIFEQDLESIKDILSSTGFFEGAPDEIDAALKSARQALKDGNTIENHAFLFLEQDAETIGYTCFSRIPCTLSTYEIHWLAVHNNQRGRGIGKLLLNEVIKIIRQAGASKLILKTAGRDLYIPTQKFYLSCGFKEEARLKNYYSKGDDCLIYSMDF